MYIVDLDFEMSDIKHLQLSQSPVQIFLHYLYSVLKPFLTYEKKVLENLVLYDNGMEIRDSFIPYEYLVRVAHHDPRV